MTKSSRAAVATALLLSAGRYDPLLSVMLSTGEITPLNVRDPAALVMPPEVPAP